MTCFVSCRRNARVGRRFDNRERLDSDSKCGAKGANARAEACTKKCLAAGAKMVVVTDGDQKVLTVDNPDALKGHEGHHVAVTGSVAGDSIHVDSVKML